MNQSSTSTPTQRSTSLTQQVVEGLTDRIRRGELKPGERVPTEPALMQEFGVSRSVVREAVSRLQASGLLLTRQGVGSFVLASRIDPALMQSSDAVLKLQQKLAMLELRLTLEAEAAALAAQRRTEPQLAAMESALHDYDGQHGAGEGTAEADFRFHELIAQATGNEYFVHVLRSLSGATIPALNSPSLQPRPTRRTYRFGDPSPELQTGKDITSLEHWSVLEAIRRSDASAARAAMFMHLNNSRERMKRASS